LLDDWTGRIGSVIPCGYCVVECVCCIDSTLNSKSAQRCSGRDIMRVRQRTVGVEPVYIRAVIRCKIPSYRNPRHGYRRIDSEMERAQKVRAAGRFVVEYRIGEDGT